MQTYGYWKGKTVPTEEIRISSQDLGVLRGYGVFDVMRTENGKPFLLDRHWNRLGNSAKALDLELPVQYEEYRDIVQTLLKKNALSKASIRTVLTGGESPDAFLPEKGKETFFILVSPFRELPGHWYENGAKVMVLDFFRSFPQAKITHYVTAIRNAAKKQKVGALEILYVREGTVLEASTSNFGIFSGDTVIMPQADALPGVTRGLALELARELGFSVEERALSLEETLAADEAFLTATNKYVVPVTFVDEHRIGGGKPGTRTKKLLQAMKEFCGKY